MASTQVEREVKLEAPAEVDAPDFDQLVPGGGSLDFREIDLESVYFDTAEHTMLASGVTLRRRTGNEDEGWQLKVPTGDHRIEYRLPLSDAGVPAELVALTTAFRRGGKLRHVVTIRTHRRVHEIGDAAGETLLEIADDDVHSMVPVRGGVRVEQWREFEIEQGPVGRRKDVTAARDLLLDAGATATASVNKVARALGTNPGRRPVPTGSGRTAGDVITAYLREQDRVLLDGDLALRRGGDAIHPTRVATRRLRSMLKVFAEYFDPDQAARFDTELSWYASVLGNVRDRQVQRQRMRSALADLEAEHGADLVGSTADEVDRALAAEEAEGSQELGRALIGRRYTALIRMCGVWADRAPFTVEAESSPDSLLKALSKARRKVRKHLAVGLHAGEPEELHKARKGAKRARYAAELATPILSGRRSDRLVAHYRDIQDILGEHQDSVAAAELLHRLGAPTGDHAASESFTLGILWAEQQRRANKARRKANTLAN